MSNLNVNANAAASLAAQVCDNQEQPKAVHTASVHYQAAEWKQPVTRGANGVLLDQPGAQDKKVAPQTVSKLDLDVQLVLLLAELSKKIQESYEKQKSTEANAALAAKQSQVDETVKSGIYQAVITGISGAFGVAGTASTGFNFGKGLSQGSQQKLLNQDLTQTQEKLAALKDVAPAPAKIEEMPVGKREFSSVSERFVTANEFLPEEPLASLELSTDAQSFHTTRSDSVSSLDSPAPIRRAEDYDQFEWSSLSESKASTHSSLDDSFHSLDDLPSQKTLDATKSESGTAELHANHNDRLKEVQAALDRLVESGKKREGTVDLVKAFLGTVDKLLGSSFQTKQTFIGADSKEFDIEAGVHDGKKQKFVDLMKAADDFMKELRQLLNELTTQANQTKRAITVGA